MSFAVNESVTWIGKTDWELRKFHGEEYSTHGGTTYNSYLVRDEKVAVIDTVWTPYADQYVANLAQEIDLGAIDFVVATHAEADHSGALPALMRAIPGVPLYCTANAVKSLRGHYHQDWNFQVVKSGDRLRLGKKELIFIEAPMLHWPDTMFCYLTGDQYLFSSDAFGQHLASERLFNDEVDQCRLFQECIKYYANILTPFSRLVEKKIQEFVALGLPLTMICPSHGVLWRQDPLQIVGKYREWAGNYREEQVVVIYDTMWNGTRRMAETIGAGMREQDPNLVVKIFNSARADLNDIITEVFRAKAVLVGSPTINKGVLSSVAAILEEMRGLGFKGKKGAAFGAYGWSGESVKTISARLQEGGFELLNPGLRILWNPDDQALAQCRLFGQEFVKGLAEPVAG